MSDLPNWVKLQQKVVLRERLSLGDELTLSIGRTGTIEDVAAYIKVNVADSNGEPGLDVSLIPSEFIYFWRPEDGWQRGLRTET